MKHQEKKTAKRRPLEIGDDRLEFHEDGGDLLG